MPMRVTFPCGDLSLEGELTIPNGCRCGVVVCHPHPQYGGDMDNSVVTTVADVFQRAGVATLRFNFRGVGASGGSYGAGIGEADDARAAVRFLIARSTTSDVTLAGYSFGAMVALRTGMDMPEVACLIGVAPPVSFFNLGVLRECTKPKLIVAGDRDQYAAAAQLRQQVAELPEPKALHILPGADHFFAGHEPALAGAVRTFIDEMVRTANPTRPA